MSVLAPPRSRLPAAIPRFPVYRLTVEDYDRMIEAGIFTEDDRLELLKGWVVPKMAHNPPHPAAISLTMPVLNQALPPGWYLQVQLPIVTDDSEPEPDFSVIRGKPRDYKGRKPGSADTGLAIEVADSSLDQERDLKGPIYAGARIPIYWIINLKEEKVEVYTDPAGSDESAAYASRADYGMNESVPLVLDGREVARIPVPELLP